MQRVMVTGKTATARSGRGRAAIHRFAAAAVVALALIAPLAPSAQASDDALDRAINKADQFLRTEQRGKDALSYIHFGAAYHGHQYLRTTPVTDRDGRPIEGEFALVYRYKWEDDGISDVAYLCHADGSVYEVDVVYTNAVLARPFVWANATIRVLGNLLIEAYDKKMSPFERRLVQKLVDNADAKGLLELSLGFQQALGM